MFFGKDARESDSCGPSILVPIEPKLHANALNASTEMAGPVPVSILH
jgi:hypothetical protein